MKNSSCMIVCVALIHFGCNNNDSVADYKITLHSGMSTIPWVVSIDELVPRKDVDHFITHYGFDSCSPCEWQIVVYFYGRYRMQIVQNVEIDYRGNKIKNTVGEMRIVINEVTDISEDGYESSYGDQVRCGAVEFEKFVQSGGDFTVFPMKITKDHPLPNFDLFRSVCGKDIVQ